MSFFGMGVLESNFNKESFCDKESQDFNSELYELKDSIEEKKTFHVNYRNEIEKINQFRRLTKKTCFSYDDVKFINENFSEEFENIYHDDLIPSKIKIEEIDNKALEYLVKTGKFWYISGKLKRFSLDNAKCLASLSNNSYVNDVDLSGIEDIQEEVLKELSTGCFNSLILGIKKLTNNLVDILYGFKGNTLIFQNLTEISDYAAKKFSSQRNYKLFLYSIKKLSDSQFDYLSGMNNSGLDFRYKNFIIDVENLESLTKHQIENGIIDELKYGKVKTLGITEISDDVAEAIGKHVDGIVSLPNLKSITDKQMHLLLDEAMHKSSYLNDYITLDFSGLSSITDEQLEILATVLCDIKLDGLSSLSDKQAKILRTSWYGRWRQIGESSVFERHSRSLSLAGLTKISKSQLEDLLSISYCSLNLSGIKKLSDDLWGILISHCRTINDGYLVDEFNLEGVKKGLIPNIRYIGNGIIRIGCEDYLSKEQKKTLGPYYETMSDFNYSSYEVTSSSYEETSLFFNKR